MMIITPLHPQTTRISSTDIQPVYMGTAFDNLPPFPVYDKQKPPEPGQDFSEGAVFLVDKPVSWSSFDVVKFLRGRLRVKKTGHAGTLDPLATGLLIICAGRATKSIESFQAYPKRYHGIATLGASTPSQDAATEPDQQAPVDHIREEEIKKILSEQFTGVIRQIPPMYSALWKDGKRLYSYARKGETVEREPRDAEVHEIRVISFGHGKLELDVLCGKGTYIRTLVHDLGIALDSRAHLSQLRRTAIGPFQVQQALTIEQLREIYSKPE